MCFSVLHEKFNSEGRWLDPRLDATELTPFWTSMYVNENG
jgi:hypothetical protein